MEELSPEEVRSQFETNFFGVVRMVNAVLPIMRHRGRGHIVNVGSLSGLSAIPFLGIYSASKCALEGYTEAQAKTIARLKRFLPAGLYERGVRRTFWLDDAR